LKRASHAEESERLGILERLKDARKTLEEVESPAYLEKLRGTSGVEPIEAYL
jgi:hypothetical protein